VHYHAANQDRFWDKRGNVAKHGRKAHPNGRKPPQSRLMAGAPADILLPPTALLNAMPTIESNQALPDILGHGLNVVFCGINPGVDAAAAGHHFLGRGNRFWPVLHLAGFTPRQLAPEEDKTALDFGIGLTAAVARATQRADQLEVGEFAEAGAVLADKLALYRPQVIAFLGKAAYAGITGKRNLEWGAQPELFGGARVWILPNPSGLNRGFTKYMLVEAYSALRRTLT